MTGTNAMNPHLKYALLAPRVASFDNVLNLAFPPRKKGRVQLTPYLPHNLGVLTLGLKAFPFEDVRSGFDDASCVAPR